MHCRSWCSNVAERLLYPCPSVFLRSPALPADSYEQTKVLAPLFNTLVDRISRDGPWLKEVLKDVLVRDG